MEDARALSDRIREVAYAIHVCPGHGYLEKFHENARANRLRKIGLGVLQQHPVAVYDEDCSLIGSHVADLMVNDLILIELKAANRPMREHEAQLPGYLKATRLRHGLLVNSGCFKFEIRKFVFRSVVITN